MSNCRHYGHQWQNNHDHDDWFLLNADRTAGEARLAGNIGFPASTVAQETTAKDDLVMELSSFQLMGIETFHPQIAVITNIFEAHLDYHGSRKEYVLCKMGHSKT